MTSIPFNINIPVLSDVDVVVVGGGPSGIAAALGAARNGVKTALIERYGFLGGMSTAALVGPFMTSFSDDGEIQLVRGVFDELVRRMEDIGGAIHPEKVRAGSVYSSFIEKGHDHVTPFNAEAVKLVAVEMLQEAGVEIYFHSMFLSPLVEDNRVKGAIIANKSGIQAIKAKVTVDCSADGDVAYRSGVNMEFGRKQDGLTQPMTMFFRVTGVDNEAVIKYVDEHPEEKHYLFSSIIEEQRKKGNWTLQKDKVGIYQEPQKDVWRVNTSRIQGLNGTDVKDLTQAEIEGRKQVFELMDFFKKYLPGFKHASLIDTGVQVGIRETRRIVGMYTLTADDLITGRGFDDTIALYSYPIDIHSPTDGSTEFNDSFTTANIYQLPYRILVPESVDGLLVAGRCVSATHEALAAIRVMPCAFALGQAAGAGASCAVKDGIQPRNVNSNELQRVLEKQNAVLPKHIPSLSKGAQS